MSRLSRISLVDRVSAHLREGILARRWTDRLPGIRTLSSELGVGRHTLRAAFGVLVNEGLISGGKAGESYAIVARGPAKTEAGLRLLNIAVLIGGRIKDMAPGVRTPLLRIANEAREQGHRCFFVTAPSTTPRALSGLVAKTEADAWFVYGGATETLAWFAGAGIPALAIGGRHRDLDIASASISMTEPVRDAVRELVRLGHRRIVLIIAGSSRKPTFGPVATAFREELARAGIRPGEYHTPDWEPTPEGLDALLDSLFKVTPPTALLCWPHRAMVGVLTRLTHRGLKVPGDICLFTEDDDPSFEWICPGIRMAHLSADTEGWFRRIRAWTKSVAENRPDKRQVDVASRLVPGNTFGPAKK